MCLSSISQCARRCFTGVYGSQVRAQGSRQASLATSVILKSPALQSRYKRLRRKTRCCKEFGRTVLFLMLAPFMAISALVMLLPFVVMLLQTMIWGCKCCRSILMVQLNDMSRINEWMGHAKADSPLNNVDYQCWCYMSCCCMFDPEFMEPMPEKLRGVFFCEGDIRLEDCTTFEYSRWDPENLTLLVYPFFPNTVTYPATFRSLLRMQYIRWFRLTNVINFDHKNMQDAAIRLKVWGITLPAWAAFSTLHQADEEAAPTGELWFRLGTMGGYALRKVSTEKGEKIQPAFDEMVGAVAAEEVVTTYPSVV